MMFLAPASDIMQRVSHGANRKLRASPGSGPERLLFCRRDRCPGSGGPDSERIGETARRAGSRSARTYKFAVLWSGQEGSLLFWSLSLAAYGLVLRCQHKTDQRLFAHASVVIAAVQLFFLLLLNFAAHPFAQMQGRLPNDGSGLNPLLQGDQSCASAAGSSGRPVEAGIVPAALRGFREPNAIPFRPCGFCGTLAFGEPSPRPRSPLLCRTVFGCSFDSISSHESCQSLQAILETTATDGGSPESKIGWSKCP